MTLQLALSKSFPLKVSVIPPQAEMMFGLTEYTLGVVNTTEPLLTDAASMATTTRAGELRIRSPAWFITQ